ncbi:MAG: CotH kinase family protein [Myxococcales bacterium]|nr:CotH kinase family protein [Myxococcales bacterium]
MMPAEILRSAGRALCWGLLACTATWALAGCGDGGGETETEMQAEPQAGIAGDGGRRMIERTVRADAGVDDGPFSLAPTDPAAYIYDQNQLRTYELRLSEKDLAFLDADPQAEQYVEGSMIFEGEEIGPVGIRYKGSIGAFRRCVDAGGKKTCQKLSTKVKFNWKDPDAKFYGLRKLQFHAMNNDPSMLKERLGYWLNAQFGLPTSRAVHARLLINGEFHGIFALIEQIDGRLTRSRFREGGKGNLFKEAWPLDADGNAITEEALIELLKTNEDENPSLDGFLAFGQALAAAPLEQKPEVLESFIDVDYSLRYLAANWSIGKHDGLLHWYCTGDSCWNHNYYWYEEEAQSRFWLIAWDLDNAFNVDNTTTTMWFEWDDTTLGCAPESRPPFNIPQRLSSCDGLTWSLATHQERYLELLQEFRDGPFTPEKVEAQLLTWEEQIWPVVREAAAAHEEAVSVEDWNQARAWLRASIEALRQRIADRIAEGPKQIGDPWAVE